MRPFGAATVAVCLALPRGDRIGMHGLAFRANMRMKKRTVEASVRLSRILLLAVCLIALTAFPGLSPAQDALVPAIQTTVGVSSLTVPQYDELVAPIALYPDALLADTLAASTYPLEVVEADRWASDPANASLSDDNLTAALDVLPWDPSVKSLVPFPDVLGMLDSHLDWMEELGQAFLGDPDAVLAAVQRMRARALTAGNLSSDAEETVSDTDNEIAISPPPSDDLYVPQYDPWCAFGNWPYSVPAPYFFEPWPGYCEPAQYSVVYAPGIAWPFSYWSWGYFDWRHRKLLVRRDYYNRFHPVSAPKNNVWYHDAKQDALAAAVRIAQNNRAHAPLVPARPLSGANNLARAQRPFEAFRRFSPPRIVQMAPQRPMALSRPASRPVAHGFAPEHSGPAPSHR